MIAWVILTKDGFLTREGNAFSPVAKDAKLCTAAEAGSLIYLWPDSMAYAVEVKLPQYSPEKTRERVDFRHLAEVA